MRLDPALPPGVIRKRICRARRCEEQRAHEVAFYLDVIERRRFYLAYGFSSIHDFARVELGLEKRQVRERLRIVRALKHLPRLGKAFRGGKIAFSAVREITRVATPASEAGWIRAAATRSVREIERMVAASKRGEVPKPPRLGLPRNLLEVSFRVTPEQMALIETVCARESEEAGRDIDLAELMLRGIHYLYESEPVLKESAGAREGKRARGTTHGGSPPRKRRRPRPELVTIQCRTCREAAVSTREGFVASDPERLDAVAGEARVRDATRPGTSSPPEDEPGLVSTPDMPDVPPEKRDLPQEPQAA